MPCLDSLLGECSPRLKMAVFCKRIAFASTNSTCGRSQTPSSGEPASRLSRADVNSSGHGGPGVTATSSDHVRSSTVKFWEGQQFGRCCYSGSRRLLDRQRQRSSSSIASSW